MQFYVWRKNIVLTYFINMPAQNRPLEGFCIGAYLIVLKFGDFGGHIIRS